MCLFALVEISFFDPSCKIFAKHFALHVRNLPDLGLESSSGLSAVTGLSHHTVGVNISVFAWNWLSIFSWQYSWLAYAYPWLSHPRILSPACKFRPLPETFTLWMLDNLDIKHKTAISQIVRSWEWEGDTLHDATQTQSQGRGVSKWLIMLTCAGRPWGHVSRDSPLLIVIDKYCCYQNLRRRQQINLLPVGMSKYTRIISQEPSVRYRYGYHHWLTHMVCLYKQRGWCLKPHMVTQYLVSVCVAAVDVLVVHIAEDGHRRGARCGGGGLLEVVAEAEQRALGPGGGAASCHQYKQDLQWEVRIRNVGDY